MRYVVNRITESVRLLELIAEASDPTIEIELLEVANCFFSKHSPSDRRVLCDSGAAKLVLKCLHRCRQFGDGCVTVLTCNLLGKLLFNSIESVTQFLCDNGVELMSLLFELFEKQNEMSSQRALIELFHQLGRSRVSLSPTRNGEVLVSVLQRFMYENDHRATLASMLLSAWTSDHGSGSFVAQLPNAVQKILDCALATTDYLARFYIAQILRNLAMDTPNQEQMARTKGFLRSLELLLSVEHGPTKIEAIGTVEILASNSQCKTLICSYNRASIIKMMAKNLELFDFKVGTARALFRLIETNRRHPDKRCPDLVRSLVCLSSKESVENEAAAVAAYSLMRLAKYIPVGHKAHPIMMKALGYLSSSCNAVTRIWAAIALLEHSKSQTSAFVLVRIPQAVKALVTLANDFEKGTRNLAIQTMLRIASDISSMKLLFFNSELMEAVVKHALNEIQQFDLANDTVELILAFTSLRSSHARLAKQFGLVESLASYGLHPGAGENLRRRSLYAVSILAAHL